MPCWKIFFAVLCTLGIALDAGAQPYPSRPVRVIVGFAAGGNVDIAARLITQRLSQALGQPVVVDNRSGGGGTIGSTLVARSAPDGYTLLVMSSSLVINALAAKKPPYDPVRDFAPISTITSGPHFMSVSAALPVNSVRELIAHARARPGTINFGSGGVGSLVHFEGELFKLAAGIDIVHVPYKSTAQAFAEVAAGSVHLMFSSTVSTLPFAKTGRVRIIAVTGSRRLTSFPDVPTVSESGLPGFVVDSIAGLLAPAGTPREIVQRLSGEVARVLEAPEIRAALIAQGGEARGSTPQEYAQRIAEELVRWKKVVAASGVTAAE